MHGRLVELLGTRSTGRQRIPADRLQHLGPVGVGLRQHLRTVVADPPEHLRTVVVDPPEHLRAVLVDLPQHLGAVRVGLRQHPRAVLVDPAEHLRALGVGARQHPRAVGAGPRLRRPLVPPLVGGEHRHLARADLGLDRHLAQLLAGPFEEVLEDRAAAGGDHAHDTGADERPVHAQRGGEHRRGDRGERAARHLGHAQIDALLLVRPGVRLVTHAQPLFALLFRLALRKDI
ncbi:hypothetical protein [Streptomyces xanthochromogenes]